ncbi:GH32 C-terminal domain-containing protein [Bacillus gobiensis]|uniref:GH32 C-terminal domain-containing protein n=1 Tax=Bacillus gobiensis TaxID=1441095 RepID=UPI003D25F8B7
MRLISRLLIVALLCSVVFQFNIGTAAGADYYKEPFRNQFHFSPEANWMNDPNGMVFFEGEYHLFYQYYPYGTTWGPMHWGHAVSKDLVNWEHLPMALLPDENGWIFSGSAVIDKNNTAGFGQNAMVAIFTHADGPKQVQSIAYSLDKGRTWTKYQGNPVMPNPPIADWRDPKVFWHDGTQKWVMTLAAKDKIMFYTSPDLKNWSYASEFGPDGGIQANTAKGKYSYSLSNDRGTSFTYEGDVMNVEKNGRIGAGGLLFRSDDTAKNGYAALLDAEEKKVKLVKIENGIPTEMRSKDMAVQPSKSYHLKVVTDGPNISVFVNGTSELTASDTSFENGKFGLIGRNSTAVIRNATFTNTTNVITNLSGFQPAGGEWTKTLEGLTGSSSSDAFTVANETGTDLIYKADIKVSGSSGGKGAGALLFKADRAAQNGYVANVDALNDKVKLMKIVGGQISVLAEKTIALETDRQYELKVATLGDNIKVYLDETLIHDIYDGAFSSGHFGLNVWNAKAVFQNIKAEKNIVTNETNIKNADFETGNFSGWEVLSGNAFSNAHVTNATSYWGGSFGHQGNYHLWGAAQIPFDEPTGEARSSYFKLSGSGEINFMLGGGNNESTYLALMRASDDKEILRQTNTKWKEDETYRRYIWDASAFRDEVLYLKLVDYEKNGWGHINVDDIKVNNTGSMPENIDKKAQPVEENGEARNNGTIDNWTAVSGEWVNSTYGNNGGVWECPALFQLPVAGDPSKKKWVLQVSVGDGAAAGGSGGQYFIGEFDGKTFKSDNPPQETLWTDYGADFYAAVEWNNTAEPNGEKYWLGWMSNWKYANHTPTTTWRSSMTLPRKMELAQTPEGLRLQQTPVSLQSLRLSGQGVQFHNKLIQSDQSLSAGKEAESAEFIVEFDVAGSGASEVGLKVRKGINEETVIGYDLQAKKLFVDRSKSGSFDFGPDVKGIHAAPMPSEQGKIRLHVFLDHSSVEVFGNQGKKVITDQIFPGAASKGVELYSKGGTVNVAKFEMYPLSSIWKESPFSSNLTGWQTKSGLWADTMKGKQGQSEGDSFILSSQTGTNFTYEADIEVLDTDSHPNDPNKDTVDNRVGAGGLVFRSDNTAKNAYVANVDIHHDAMKLIRFNNGVPEELQVVPKDLDPNKKYHLKAVTNQNTIKIYLNGELVIEKNDDVLTNGYYGLNVWHSTTAFQNVRATQ